MTDHINEQQQNRDALMAMLVFGLWGFAAGLIAMGVVWWLW